MILKYKLDNGAWKFKTVKDFTIGKVDITNIVNKHINETGKMDKYDDKAFDDLRVEFSKVSEYDIVDAMIDYNGHDSFIKVDTFNKRMNYLVVSYIDVENTVCGKCMILANETYLMSDEGKTIEKLI